MSFFRTAAVIVPALLCACISVPRESILREQDRRAPYSSVLKEAACASSPRTRGLAYLAMGRIQSESYLAPLVRGLNDSDPGVGAQAAFSLGQLGLAEPALSTPTVRRAAVALAAFAARVDGERRRAAVEALGKTGGPEAEALLVGYLHDPQAPVRGEAALALFRQRFLQRVPAYSSAAVSALTGLFADPDAGARWRAVYAFSRFAEPRAAAALSIAAADPSASARFFACRALGLLKARAPTKSLVKALSDTNYLVRAEAVRALGQAGRADLLDLKVISDPSAHVRAAAADAMAASGDRKLDDWLDDLLRDSSPMVRGQALLAVPKLRPRLALKYLEGRAADGNWWIRSQAYAALADVPGAREFIRGGLNDKDARAAAAAMEALAKSSSTELDAILDLVLRDQSASLELIGAAVDAAGARKSAALLPALRTAYAGNLAQTVSELADDIKEAYEGSLHAHPQVKEPDLPQPPPKEIVPSEFIAAAPPAAATVALETDKGVVELELATDDAPIHSATFIDNVRKGLYDGTVWHRVVSGFVVQGGDPRGSGWGDGGVSLRDEINRLPFERGTLGMPKAGKDTGGCQLFITHVPTPHLDGRYTVFGKVVFGMEVVDRLEPGDRIRRAYVK